MTLSADAVRALQGGSYLSCEIWRSGPQSHYESRVAISLLVRKGGKEQSHAAGGSPADYRHFLHKRYDAPYTDGSKVRLVVVNTSETQHVQDGRDASKIQKSFNPREDLVGVVAEIDGDRYRKAPPATTGGRITGSGRDTLSTLGSARVLSASARLQATLEGRRWEAWNGACLRFRP